MDSILNLLNIKIDNNKPYILVTDNITKNKLLQHKSNNKELNNNKIMSSQEFISNFYYDLSITNLKQLKEDNNTTYSIASIIQQYDFYNQELKDIKHIKDMFNIIIYDINFDTYILNHNNDFIIHTNTLNNTYKEVYKFEHISLEIDYVLQSIIKLLDQGTSLDKIYLGINNDTYLDAINIIFSVYGIKVNNDYRKSLYSYTFVKNIITSLNEDTFNLEDYNHQDKDILNSVINILNETIELGSYKDNIDYIIFRLKNTYINTNYSNTLKVFDINSNNLLFEDEYLFVLGCNNNDLVKYYKDNKYMSDKELVSKGVDSILDRNKKLDIHIKSLISKDNVFLSFATKVISKEEDISKLLLDYKIVEHKDVFNISDSSDKILLSKLNNNYKRYKLDSSLREDLKKNINLKEYDNSFNGNDLFLNKDITFSATSLEEYYKCPYMYYLKRVLRINKYSKSSSILYIGNLFHEVIDQVMKSYVADNNIDLSREISNEVDEYNNCSFLKAFGKEPNDLDNYYLNKHKEFLYKLIVLLIEEYNVLDFNHIEFEKEFKNVEFDQNLYLQGKVDKIISKVVGEDIYLEIYDYKTGDVKYSTSLFEYGLNLQNIIYYFLYSYSHKDENGKDILIASFKHKINFPSPLKDDEKLEDKLHQKGVYTKIQEDTIFDRPKKIMSQEDLDNQINIVKEKIIEARDNIFKSKFDINPKIHVDTNISCKYCTYKTICYKQHKDYDYIGGK